MEISKHPISVVQVIHHRFQRDLWLQQNPHSAIESLGTLQQPDISRTQDTVVCSILVTFTVIVPIVHARGIEHCGWFDYHDIKTPVEAIDDKLIDAHARLRKQRNLLAELLLQSITKL